jgi:hypothetical protein
MLTQLNPSIPVETPRGRGEAVIVIDYSKEDDLMWVVFLDKSRQCWMFNNKDIMACENYTIRESGKIGNGEPTI